MKKIAAAILFVLWSGFFCLFLPVQPVEAAYGGGLMEERFPQSVASDYFAQLAREKLESELARTGETRRHTLDLVRAPMEMRLPPGALICEVELPQPVRYGGVTPVYIRVFVDGAFYRRAICYYRVTVYENILIAVHDLMIEKPVAAADVRVEERSVTGNAGQYLTSPEELMGRVPVRMIRAGSPLGKDMLQNPVIIESGAPVTLLASFNGVEVKTDGVALQKGRKGAVIRVRNARSGKMLRGRVVDAATVEILNGK